MSLALAAIPVGVVAGSKALGWCLRRKRSIKGKVVLLTGASRGLGAEMAVEFAKEGVKLCLVARSQAALQNIAAECIKAGAADVLVLACDVSDLKSLADMVHKCKAKLGAVEILINNAGIECLKEMHEMDPQEIANMNAVNVTAPMVLSRLLLPDMLAAKYGVICVVSSVAGGMFTPAFNCYAATKAAVNSFCVCLRAELQGTGVSAFAIMPGVITNLKTGGMAADLFPLEVLNKKWSLKPMDYFVRCTGSSVNRKIVAHVKMGAPNPLVGAMRMPIWSATFLSTLFPVTGTKLLWAITPFKGELVHTLAKRSTRGGE